MTHWGLPKCHFVLELFANGLGIDQPNHCLDSQIFCIKFGVFVDAGGSCGLNRYQLAKFFIFESNAIGSS